MHATYKTQLARVAVVATALCAALATPADDYRRFPGEAFDNQTLGAQQKVEELYQGGEYKRALLIYEKELAPMGDKYAQYMVGYMHLTGQGVDSDPAVALAWYRLAAERGEAPLRQARNELERSLDTEELARVDEIFANLWQQYSDRRLLLELIADDLEILRDQTGSRLPDSRPNTMIVSGHFGARSSEEFYRSVRERLERRRLYLDSTASPEQAGIVAGNSTIRHLESEVEKGLKALNSP